MMAQLGGGGSQTAWGYQCYHGNGSGDASSVGLAAGVGPDLPTSCLDWFNHYRIDTSGLQVHQDVTTPRAWQILEDDGRRHEVRFKN